MFSVLRPAFNRVVYFHNSISTFSLRKLTSCARRTNVFPSNFRLRIFPLSSSDNWKKLFSNDIRRRIDISKFKNLSQKDIEEIARELEKKQKRDTLYYAAGISIFMVGVCWIAIPLYRMFCESTGVGGAVGKYKRDADIIETMPVVENRLIRIRFNADTGGSMFWQFKPLQESIYVHPGETALAFFTATNPTDKPIIGVSTYNIVPYEAAPYFNKIQCFCFEEQLLNPGEQVDMPVFFYLDPDFAYDPIVERLPEVTLSYTFFQSKSNLPLRKPRWFSSNKTDEGKDETSSVAKNIITNVVAPRETRAAAA